MRYLVVGAGALGGYFGARLLEVGADVTFLLRPGRAQALQRTGLVVTSRFGDLALAPPRHVLADTIDRTFDVVIVACKAYDLADTMNAFAPAVGAETAIVPLLNGMRHLDDLARRFGAARVLGGLCLISATLDDAGVVQHLNDLHTLSFGELDGSPSARFDGRASEQILQEMWEKWVFIASIAGLNCLMRASVGDVVAADGTELALALMDECRAIAAANGHAPRAASIERTRATAISAGSPVTASMLKDIERGARVEADHVIGDLLGRAGNATPALLLRAAYVHLRAYEARRARAAKHP